MDRSMEWLTVIAIYSEATQPISISSYRLFPFMEAPFNFFSMQNCKQLQHITVIIYHKTLGFATFQFVITLDVTYLQNCMHKSKSSLQQQQEQSLLAPSKLGKSDFYETNVKVCWFIRPDGKSEKVFAWFCNVLMS